VVLIKNRQRKIKIDNKELATRAQKMLNVAGYEKFDLAIVVTTNKTIRAYNKKYRKKDTPTDILSFSYHSIQPGKAFTTSDPEEMILGDIIISLEYAQNNAQLEKQTLLEHVTMLIAHGIAHLLGYDHETDADYAKMTQKEQQLLKSL
jgi:metalloprotein, YbeY/UPF0054 family